jgi:hypothetical protein
MALQRLAALSLTGDSVRQDLEMLEDRTASSGYPCWTGNVVLLMTNGQFLVFKFWHGANNGFVDHLFLAHTSDGRWLYSTYHFCDQMATLVNDTPPGSLAEFERTYFAREFDGKSDVCLKPTWPPKR